VPKNLQKPLERWRALAGWVQTRQPFGRSYFI